MPQTKPCLLNHTRRTACCLNGPMQAIQCDHLSEETCSRHEKLDTMVVITDVDWRVLRTPPLTELHNRILFVTAHKILFVHHITIISSIRSSTIIATASSTSSSSLSTITAGTSTCMLNLSVVFILVIMAIFAIIGTKRTSLCLVTMLMTAAIGSNIQDELSFSPGSYRHVSFDALALVDSGTHGGAKKSTKRLASERGCCVIASPSNRPPDGLYG